ncbi:hypothetical protein Tco_0583000, partial [Tanacetum coccineum]
VEFRRISLTGFRSCTSRSHYQSVSKQTTRYSIRIFLVMSSSKVQSLFNVTSLSCRVHLSASTCFSLGLGDVDLLLVSFDSQLKIFKSLLNNHASGEHS